MSSTKVLQHNCLSLHYFASLLCFVSFLFTPLEDWELSLSIYIRPLICTNLQLSLGILSYITLFVHTIKSQLRNFGSNVLESV